MHTGCCMFEARGGTGGAMLRAALVLLVLASPAFADDAPAPPPPAAALAPAPPDPDAAKLRELEARLWRLEHPAPPPKPAEPPQPLDVREPTFGEYDFSWMNGNNPQP